MDVNDHECPACGALQLGEGAAHQADQLCKLLVAPAVQQCTRHLLSLAQFSQQLHTEWLHLHKCADASTQPVQL
jgi:hypothetical protein